jgi:protein kinase-like protein
MDASRVGPFALEEKLGPPECQVYRAVHVQQRRQVALKVLPVSLAANLHGRLLFNDEMALLKRLQDPSIVRCFGGNLDERHAFIAYEIVEGESLASLLARRGRLGWEATVDFALQICQALKAAHELELTHHDLTPDKILVTADGKIKVTDFRKARDKNPLCVSSQTRSLPRVAYQSPEQLRRAETITHKADLYMLGCVLFEMLSGRPPFVGTSADEVAEAHLTQLPPRVSSLALDCPVWLDALVAQLLEKEPNKRPHTVDAVILALEETIRNMASGAGVARHALAGISALKVPVNKQEVRRLFGGKRRDDDAPGSDTPLWERPWFLVVSLSLLVAVFGLVLSIPFWPVSEEKLIARADKLMASDDPARWQEAKDNYLDPLLARNPDGKYAERAREHLDTIEMHQAERRLKNRLRFGRELAGEAQRLYAEALKFEEFGDQATALERYESMVTLVKPQGDDRPYVLLAQRQIARLKEAGSARADSRGQFIEEKLAEADKLYAEGQVVKAREIVRSVETLYGDNAEMAPYMEQVHQRLAGMKSKPAAEEGEMPPVREAVNPRE